MAHSTSGMVRTVNPKVDGTQFELDFNDDETAARVLQYIRHKGVGIEEVTVGRVAQENGLWVAYVTLQGGRERRMDNTLRNPFAAARMLQDFRVVKRDIIDTSIVEVAGGEEAVTNALDNSDKREDKRTEDKATRAEKRAMRAAAYRKMLQDKEEAAKAAASQQPVMAAD